MVTLQEAALGPETRHVSAHFGWDFTTRACRACHGDMPVPEMPENWTNAGHRRDCWVLPFLEDRPLNFDWSLHFPFWFVWADPKYEGWVSPTCPEEPHSHVEPQKHSVAYASRLTTSVTP